MTTSFRFSSIAAALLMTLGLGCAKTDDQKVATQTQVTQIDADKAVAELSASTAKLQAAASPAVSWTPDQLKGYESLVNQTEVDLNRVQSYQGKGVAVPEESKRATLRQLIQTRKNELAEVRSKQNAEAAEQQVEEQVQQLKTQYDQQVATLSSKGTPATSWTVQQLDEYGQILDQIDATIQAVEASGGQGLDTVALRAANAARRAEWELIRRLKS